MNKLLIIIDMQNDFVTGSLANPAAQAIVKPICDLIENWDSDILYTLDSHTVDYLKTTEGKYLPVEHCIVGTKGHNLVDEIADALSNKDLSLRIGPVYKPTFGYKDWDKCILDNDYDEIVMVGTCTDICVISNALALKAVYPDIHITVLKDLCAGLTPEKHEAALEVLRSCQIEVK